MTTFGWKADARDGAAKVKKTKGRMPLPIPSPPLSPDTQTPATGNVPKPGPQQAHWWPVSSLPDQTVIGCPSRFGSYHTLGPPPFFGMTADGQNGQRCVLTRPPPSPIKGLTRAPEDSRMRSEEEPSRRAFRRLPSEAWFRGELQSPPLTGGFQ